MIRQYDFIITSYEEIKNWHTYYVRGLNESRIYSR